MKVERAIVAICLGGLAAISAGSAAAVEPSAPNAEGSVDGSSSIQTENDEAAPTRREKPKRRRKKVRTKLRLGGRDAESELAYEWLWSADRRQTDFDRPVLSQKFSATLDGGPPLSAVAAYRLTGDSLERSRGGKYSFDPRALYLEYLGNSARLSLGLQEVSWGEAFGLPIVDVVNPYDVTKFALADFTAAKIPVAMLNANIKRGAGSAELIFTPEPRRSPSPLRNGTEGFGPTETAPVTGVKNFAAGRDAEFGGRLGYVLKNGLDLKPFVYRHWNRTPAYEYTAVNGRPVAIEHDERVTSSGASGSYAKDSAVFRGDFIYNAGVPAAFAASKQQGAGANEIKATAQSACVLGADLTSASGESTAGVQVEAEHWQDQPLNAGAATLGWGALRFASKFVHGAVEPSLMGWHGLGNGDAWAQVKLGWSPTGALRFDWELDEMWSGETGDAQLFHPLKSSYFRTSYKF